MIAWAGAERLAHGLRDTLDTAPRARWPLGEVSKPAAEEPAQAPSTLATPSAPSAPPAAGAATPDPAPPAQTPPQA
jgi:N6-L-threonylcarbamoyladenine synthase